MANKLILISVDEDLHAEYKVMLCRRKKGERIRYKLGDAANKKMKRDIREKL